MAANKIHSILLIDDDEDEYDLVTEAIEKTGKDAEVSFLFRQEDCPRLKGKHFDIILLDINMPYQDGFSWLKKIKEKDEQVPVIMYSNSSNPEHISRAYLEGASLFFNKPESFVSLIKSLSKLLELDWENPLSITHAHIQDGKYFTFQEV